MSVRRISSTLLKALHSLATRIPKITLQRVEEIYPALKTDLRIFVTEEAEVQCRGQIGHAPKQSYLNGVCKKLFRQQSNLRKHHRIRNEECPVLCDICNKSFSNKRYMMEHKDIHNRESLFSCDACNKLFRRQRYLTAHIKRMHSSYRPFLCDVCNKSFALQSYLREHKRVHNRVCPFLCNVCNKSFRTECSLREHQKMTHNGECLFLC